MKLFFQSLAALLFAISLFIAHAEGGDALPKVKLTTSHGDIVIELNADKAPDTVANFISYVESGFYTDTLFHRVIKDFMIQGGGFDKEFTQKKVNEPIQNEANNGLTNVKGSVAMARTGDPHSATAQFFINTVDNDFLNFRGENDAAWGYAVFGQVIEGHDVVEVIRGLSTSNRGHHQNVPDSNVVIISASVLK